MCIVALKHFDDLGWVGVKNRDRNYKPSIMVKQSFSRGIERIYLYDEKTKYTEGMNENGVSILSACTQVKKDEKEGTKVNPNSFEGSPDGKKIVLRPGVHVKIIDLMTGGVWMNEAAEFVRRYIGTLSKPGLCQDGLMAFRAYYPDVDIPKE